MCYDKEQWHILCDIIFRKFWGLGFVLFDIPEDVVFWKVLKVSNILRFQGVNLAQPKMDLNCKLWVRPVSAETKFWKIVHKLSFFFLIRDYLWSTFQQNRVIFGEKGPRNPTKKATCYGYCIEHKNIWKFITWQPPMLH